MSLRAYNYNSTNFQQVREPFISNGVLGIYRITLWIIVLTLSIFSTLANCLIFAWVYMNLLL